MLWEVRWVILRWSLVAISLLVVIVTLTRLTGKSGSVDASIIHC